MFGDLPVYGGLRRDDVLLYIALDEKRASLLRSADLPLKSSCSFAMWVSSMSSTVRVGHKVISEICGREGDARRYMVEDTNGYCFKLAEAIDRYRVL